MIRQKIWDFWAARYEGLWVQKYSLGPTRGEILRFLGSKLKQGESYRILDIGCGTGQLLRDIRQSFAGINLELTGIDFSREMIRCAEGQDKSTEYKVMNVNDLKTLKKSYDIIICTHSFPYYDNQREALKDMSKLLRKNGCMLLAQASQNGFYDAVAMFFVKFTTGKAKYPSVSEVKKLAENIFYCEEVIRIKEKYYMPSIYFFVMRGI